MHDDELELIDLETVTALGGEGPAERFVNTATGTYTGHGNSWAHRLARGVDTLLGYW